MNDSDPINGLVVTVKEREIMISVWTKEISFEQRETYKQWIRDSLDLSNAIDIEYREHPKSNSNNFENISQNVHKSKPIESK